MCRSLGVVGQIDTMCREELPTLDSSGCDGDLRRNEGLYLYN